MKKEDRIISSLFEDARNEAPKVSFEQMAQHLAEQVPVLPLAEPTGLSATVKQLLLKNIGLNSIILVVGAGLAYYGLKPSTPTPELSSVTKNVLAEDSIPPALPILPIEQSLIQTQKVALPSPPLLSPADLKQKRKFNPLSSSPATSKPSTTQADSTNIAEPDPINTDLSSTVRDSQRPWTGPVPPAGPPLISTDSPSEPGITTGLTPPAGPMPPDSPIMSGSTINDKIKIDTSEIFSSTPIVLKNTYNQDATREFFTLLSSYGFVLKKKRHRFKDGLVRNVSLHLTHREGLDFKLKARRFKQLEFKLYFNESDQLFGFSICMNNNHEKEEKIISLKAKGQIIQQYRY